MDITKLPKFKYHPNLYHTQIVVFGKGICNCCKKKTEAYIESMYAEEETDCICLDCVADGKAASMFDGQFVQDADVIDNEEATDELFHRTPGYFSWQGENWKACCNDYCAYIAGLDEKDFLDSTIREQLKSGEIINDTDMTVEDIINGASYIRGYLFKCLHCNRQYLRVDMD